MLSQVELERYRRQLQLSGFGETGQRRLKGASALVTGVGGLGGAAALYLAAAGIGRLVLVRGGALRLDDMNRQVLMTHAWVGRPRVERAREMLLAMNPDVEVIAMSEYATEENADRLLSGCDVALDCAHNFDERYALNAACVRGGAPMVEAAMCDMEGYVTTFVPGETPCLACLYPEKREWDRRGFGVLGAVSGVVGCLAALEAVKLVARFGEPLRGRLLTMDLSGLEFRKFRIRRDPECQVCRGVAARASKR